MRRKTDENIEQIGHQIKKARMATGLTQEKLADKIGVTSQYLSDLERGLVGTSIATLIKLCEELHISSDFILFGYRVDDDTLSLTDRINRLPKNKREVFIKSVDLFLQAIER